MAATPAQRPISWAQNPAAALVAATPAEVVTAPVGKSSADWPEMLRGLFAGLGLEQLCKDRPGLAATGPDAKKVAVWLQLPATEASPDDGASADDFERLDTKALAWLCGVVAAPQLYGGWRRWYERRHGLPTVPAQDC